MEVLWLHTTTIFFSISLGGEAGIRFKFWGSDLSLVFDQLLVHVGLILWLWRLDVDLWLWDHFRHFFLAILWNLLWVWYQLRHFFLVIFRYVLIIGGNINVGHFLGLITFW